jgi:hypothetical protein
MQRPLLPSAVQLQVSFIALPAPCVVLFPPGVGLPWLRKHMRACGQPEMSALLDPPFHLLRSHSPLLGWGRFDPRHGVPSLVLGACRHGLPQSLQPAKSKSPMCQVITRPTPRCMIGSKPLPVPRFAHTEMSLLMCLWACGLD